MHIQDKMKYFLILMVFPFLSASECGKKKNKTDAANQQNERTDSIPACVRQIIDEATNEEPSNAPVRVDEYLYNEKTVYLVTAHCCDQYNMLYDTLCQPLCAPSGGFTGRGDGKCADFSNTAKHIKLIWKQAEEKGSQP